MAEYTARILRAVDHGHDTRSLFLERPVGLAFAPGQFLSVKLEHEGRTLTKPYTVASDPEDTDGIEIVFDRVPGGVGSTVLWATPVGASLAFTGPWGTFTLDRAPATEAVFVAEGTGIAGIRPMLRRASQDAAAPLHLLYATDHPLFTDELSILREVHVSTVPRATLLDAVRTRWVDADANRERTFYCCGIGAAVIAVRDLLRGAGYARRAVHYEKW